MKRLFYLLLFFITAVPVFAQDDLFGPGEAAAKSRKGFLITGNAGVDAPGGDMAKRFGTSYRIGPALLYKTKSNWVIGAKCDFILGNIIKEDSLMINIRDKYYSSTKYEFLDQDGHRIGVPVYERGYMIGLQLGKILPLSRNNPDNGILFLTAAGFMQHKINIFDKDKSVPQLTGDYRKGYDRLTNGAFIEEYICYNYFARNGLLNFHIGLDATFGFTQGRRDYLYDVMRTDNKQRIDMLFGLRGGWYIPVFRKKAEDLIFQ